jgi:hypothetical protein
MNPHTPSYLIPFVLTGAFASVAALLFGLHSALKRAGWQTGDRRKTVSVSTTLLLTWFFTALWLTRSGFFRGSSSRIPTIQYGVLIPIIVGLALFWRWPALRRVVESIPQQWLVGVQVYRALGLIFLVLYAAGRLPGLFALPAGIGDVLVGLFAPVVGIAYARRSRNVAGLVLAWNLFGIGDLIVALSTGFLTSPSPLQKFAFDQPNQLITAFPLAVVPAFLVPMSILLHFASLWKLRQVKEPGAHSAPRI